MAITTMRRAFAFVNGVQRLYLTEGVSVRSAGGQWTMWLFMLARSIHMYVGRSAVVDDYIHDGLGVFFLKFCATLRILWAMTANYNMRLGEDWILDKVLV